MKTYLGVLGEEVNLANFTDSGVGMIEWEPLQGEGVLGQRKTAQAQEHWGSGLFFWEGGE